MSEMRWGRYPGPVWTLIAWAVLNGLNLLFAITFPANGKHPDVVTVGTVVYAAFVTVLLLALVENERRHVHRISRSARDGARWRSRRTEPEEEFCEEYCPALLWDRPRRI